LRRRRDSPYFKPFNDYYGFARGDKVIRSTARILLESIRELPCEGDFIGHIGGDDFIIVTKPEHVEPLCSLIIRKFDTVSPSLYDEADRKRGHIMTKDRQGAVKSFPVISLSIGAVTTLHRRFSSMGEVAKVGSEMKGYAKQFKEQGSKFLVDKRC